MRPDERSERIGALVLCVLSVIVFWVARVGVAGASLAIDRREEQLATWLSWQATAPAQRDGASAPDAVALFGRDVMAALPPQRLEASRR